MKHALILVAAMALAGCGNFDWDGAARGAAFGNAAMAPQGGWHAPRSSLCTVAQSGRFVTVAC